MTKTLDCMADKLDFYQEKRCRACGRLLFKGLVVSVEIKCKKCSQFNYFSDALALGVSIKVMLPFFKDVRIAAIGG